VGSRSLRNVGEGVLGSGVTILLFGARKFPLRVGAGLGGSIKNAFCPICGMVSVLRTKGGGRNVLEVLGPVASPVTPGGSGEPGQPELPSQTPSPKKKTPRTEKRA
jgi:hypothetical protein